MMTQYHYNRNRRSKGKILVIVGTLILLSFVGYSGVAILLGGSAHSFLRPVWIFGNNVSEAGGNIDIIFVSKADLIKENDLLKEDLLHLSFLVMERTILAKENKELKESMGYMGTSTRILSTILAGGETSPYGSIALDQGLSDGVSVNDMVYVANIGVGKIEQVYKNTALLRLFSDFGQAVEVLVGDDNIVATVHGNGSGNFFFELPRDVIANVGDKIMFRGGEQRMLGVVEHIDVKPNDPFKRLIFRSPVDVNRVRWVEIELQKNE